MKHFHQPRRPSVGITPDLLPPSPDSPVAKYFLKTPYTEAVIRAGGLPFILPLVEDKALIDSYLDRVSGVVISGGAFDIDPTLYGETAREGLGTLNAQRTQAEMHILTAALQRKMPILGICGGMQLLNVAFGGTLVQDISRELPNAKLHEQKHDRTQPLHPVDVREHSHLAECVGVGHLMVNSTHHQSVKKVGDGLRVTASALDGVIEAIEATDGFVVGVQWHPELLIDSVPPNLSIYRALVAKARDRRH